MFRGDKETGIDDVPDVFLVSATILGTLQGMWVNLHVHRYDKSSKSALASFRSAVSNPSVNQP